MIADTDAVLLKERERAIAREFEAEMDRVAAGIEERAEQASRELEALENGDPASSLSTEELQRAAAMNAFVAGEVESLSVADLVRRCRTVAGSGHRAAMYALAHHAARRQDADLTGEIREAVAELRHALNPDAESRRAAARAALEEADDLRLRAQLARAGVASLGDAYSGAAGYWGAAS